MPDLPFPQQMAEQLVVNWGIEWAVIDEAVHLSESQLFSLKQRIALALTRYSDQVAQEIWTEAMRLVLAAIVPHSPHAMRELADEFERRTARGLTDSSARYQAVVEERGTDG